MGVDNLDQRLIPRTGGEIGRCSFCADPGCDVGRLLCRGVGKRPFQERPLGQNEREGRCEHDARDDRGAG